MFVSIGLAALLVGWLQSPADSMTGLTMKVFLLTLTVCLMTVVSGLTDLDLQDALRRVKLNKMVRRRLENVWDKLSGDDDPVRRCPLARFHGERSLAEKRRDSDASDLLAAASLLAKDRKLSPQTLSFPRVRQLFTRVSENLCDNEISCDGSIYRSVDGTCNNQLFPRRGAAGVTQERMLPAEYEDGIGEIKKTGKDGSALPNPRTISNFVHSAAEGPEVRSNKLTLHAFQMGQFLDHDMVKTPVIDDGTDCCMSRNSVNCASIFVEEADDSFPKNYCMPVQRSSPSVCPSDPNANTFQRDQINSITSFIDASNVYGSSELELSKIRDGATPYLRTEVLPDGVHHRLPDNEDQTKCTSSTIAPCNLAGDERVNEVPSLTSYHTLFVLEHNRLVDALRPFFADDESLFQEARKLVIAQMQKIVYDEFLPMFLNKKKILEYRLDSRQNYNYDDSINPTITNEFGIAYRFGHTWIPRLMIMFQNDTKPIVPPNVKNEFQLPTEDTYHRPDMTYTLTSFVPPSSSNTILNNNNTRSTVWGVEGLLYWLSGDNCPETDSVVEDAARNKLFLNRTTGEAFDLAALNIQRGRDHGLASFNSYRVECGLRPLKRWNSFLVKKIFGDNVNNLRKAGYASPDDIDLFTGVVAEKRWVGNPGLGLTAQCILGRQFEKLKFGDRFWYQGESVGFSTVQRKEIRRTSLASILCMNANFDKVNFPNAFDSRDPLTDCQKVPNMTMAVFGSKGSDSQVSASGFPGNGFSGSGFPGNGFSGSGFPGNGFSGSGFPGNGFSASGFPGNGFSGSGFPGNGFSGSGSGFPGNDFSGSGFPGNDFSGSGFPGNGFSGSGFPGNGFSGSGFPGNGFSGSGFPGNDFSGSGSGFPGNDFSGSGFPGNDFSASGFPGNDFSGSGFPGNDFSGSGFPGNDFAGSGFPGNGFSGSDFPGNDFSSSGFPGNDFSGSGFPGNDIKSSSGFPRFGFPFTGPVRRK